MSRTLPASLIALTGAVSTALAGPPAELPYTLELFVAATEPVGVVFAPGDFTRAYVYTNPGVIHVVKDGVMLEDPFLDISSEIISSGEKGMFGLAFDPDFQTNGTFYITYSGGPSIDYTLEKFGTLDPDHADMSSRDIILMENSPTQSHYGGWIGFHPIDGYLYVAMGDGGPPTPPPQRAQQLNTRFGKILRIDPSGPDFYPEDDLHDYAIPADNPFVGQEGVMPEIWAYGIRQPWRCSFDRDTGDLWVGEVGRLGAEEVNLVPNGVSGMNYGWPCIEGTECTTFLGCDCMTVNAVAPMHDYPRSIGRCIIGGYRYRGCEIPELEGKYVFADFREGKIFVADVASDLSALENVQDVSAMITPSGGVLGNILGMGEDAYGEIYITDRIDDVIYKFVRSDGTPVNDCNKDGVEDNCQVLDGSLADTDGNGTPDVCDSAVCVGDCDMSGDVSFNDLVSMLFQFGKPSPPAGCDTDKSGMVDFNDLVQALFVFGPCP